MRLSDLTEAVKSAYLYHGTDIGNLVSIIREDRMHSSSPRDVNRGGRGPEWEPEGVRLSRSAKTAMYFANPGFDEGIGGVLAFSRDKLKTRYKVVPFHDTITITWGDQREQEEIVATPELKPVSRYLEAILLSNERIRNVINNMDELVDDNFFKTRDDGIAAMEMLWDHPKRVNR